MVSIISRQSQSTHAGLAPQALHPFSIEQLEHQIADLRREDAVLRRALSHTQDLLRKRVQPILDLAIIATSSVKLRTAARPQGRLTPRQQEIMLLVLDGHPSKNIAADLGISQRTVEAHRAAVMMKTGCKSIAALCRFAFQGAAQPDSAGHAG